MEYKTCTKCGKDYPATPEYFHRVYDRLKEQCKNCVSGYNKQRYIDNREKILKQVSEYAKKHPYTRERYDPEASKRYREKNKEKIANYQKDYYKNNREKILERAKAKRRNNKNQD